MDQDATRPTETPATEPGVRRSRWAVVLAIATAPFTGVIWPTKDVPKRDIGLGIAILVILVTLFLIFLFA